ncbi:MAG: hypothetical protein R3C56_40910 [Pirellulaceae bacterium]
MELQLGRLQPPNAGVPATATVGDPPQSDRSQEVELTVADLAQLSEIIKSHAGKVVVVDVWSTSCTPACVSSLT